MPCNFRQIEQIGGQARQEGFVVPERSIAGDPPRRKVAALEGRLEDCSGQFRLGLKLHFLRDATLFTSLLVLGFEPALRQVEPAFHQRVTFGADVGQEHSGLAVGGLA